VYPQTGEGLRTVFTISVEAEGAETLASGSDQPSRLVYEFGWREAGKMKIQSLQSSLYDLSASTLLHCGTCRYIFGPYTALRFSSIRRGWRSPVLGGAGGESL
jgi:hypothetical protein